MGKNFFTSVSAYKTSPQQIEFFHEYTVVHTTYYQIQRL